MQDSLSQAVENAFGVRTDVAPEEPQFNSSPRRTQSPEAAAIPRKKQVDHHLWGTYLLLVFIAIVELFSASIQDFKGANIFDPILRHGMFIVVGLIIMLVVQKIHYRWVYAAIPFYVLFCWGLLIAVAKTGEDINGAVRSIKIAGTNIMPAEFMKLGAALGMAWILSKTQEKGRRDVTWWGFISVLCFMGLSCYLLFSQGLSNTLVVVAICFSMMLIGGMGLKKFFLMIAIVGVLGGAAIKIKTTAQDATELTERQRKVLELNHITLAEGIAAGRGETWKARFIRHFRSNKHLEEFSVENQQEQLSYIAQAHGGITGVGVGKSRESARLPLASLDYIYAIIVEELGLFAGLAILAIYMWILGRSAKLTIQFKQTMPGVMVMGCAFVIVFQALFHMSIVTGVFPVSGQPLPLISKGGISVLATSLAFGVMLSCSKHAVRVTDTKAEISKEQEILPDSAQSVNPVAIGQ